MPSTRLPQALTRNLRLPAVCAPMFLVSGPDLVIAACKVGMIGSFPAPNCRTIEDLDSWMRTITEALGPQDAAWAFNMVTHSSYPRFEAELELVRTHKPPLVITALGGPQRVIDVVHGYGGVVFADVNSVPFARKAAAAGADGLALVCAGAGGHTGWMSNVAFIEAVRSFFDGPIAVGGGICTGSGVAAVEAMGADLAYLGTAFIAAEESLAHAEYKAMVVDAQSTDLVVSACVTGVPASWLRPSLEKAGLDPDNLPQARPTNFSDPEQSLKGWKDIWSAGQGVGGVQAIEPAARIIDRLIQQYQGSQPVQATPAHAIDGASAQATGTD
ncbi:NAD(P)H-dependent flavin oxidoreductase [Oceanicaulis sp. LC35]|uniref:NAD(P)H-dependent flavin oxidoreductase n=1 Tax=Oceanicaulis sp. LC35 TaxID=3349635 RepID=UPI003F85378E